MEHCRPTVPLSRQGCTAVVGPSNGPFFPARFERGKRSWSRLNLAEKMGVGFQPRSAWTQAGGRAGVLQPADSSLRGLLKQTLVVVTSTFTLVN